jgi:hypothetical protein
MIVIFPYRSPYDNCMTVEANPNHVNDISRMDYAIGNLQVIYYSTVTMFCVVATLYIISRISEE